MVCLFFGILLLFFVLKIVVENCWLLCYFLQFFSFDAGCVKKYVSHACLYRWYLIFDINCSD